MLNLTPTYSLADISIIPCELTDIESRKECNCMCESLEGTRETLPIVVAPMSCNYTKLIEDVKWLLSSLGINYTKEREKHPFYYNKKKEKIYGKTAYRLSIFSNVELFNLPRKL